MSKRIKTIPATTIVAHGDGWCIEFDRFSRDFTACIEHDMDMRPIAFCRTQQEAQTKINQYRFEQVAA